MAMYHVRYAINKLAGTGGILLEHRSSVFNIDIDPKNETEFMNLLKEAISHNEVVAQNQIKIIDISQE